MAVTSIWAVHGDNVATVMKYIANQDKTDTGQFPAVASFHAVNRVLQYGADEMKTEQLLVTGILCDTEPEIAARQFLRTKVNHGGKVGGIVCFHAYQSFKRGEVDGMTAHKIGVELAKRMWGERFEVMVSTHMNTGTVHNHFCLNSVSFADGKKYYSGKALNRKLREVSDALCASRRADQSGDRKSAPREKRSVHLAVADQKGHGRSHCPQYGVAVLCR